MQENFFFFPFENCECKIRLQMTALLAIPHADPQCSRVLLIPPLTSTLFLLTSADGRPSKGFQQNMRGKVRRVKVKED